MANLHEIMKQFPLVSHHEVRELYVDQLGLTIFDGTMLRLELAVARMEEPKPPAPTPHSGAPSNFRQLCH
jgi:hypothetical protein